ncbi:CBS domain-containing protein [Hydrogenimonas thermophila]|uniref:CBS domain-containing protein n=1 Tax=Hydrogenimonas thermophila TaxID=223786 RepID=A0A1I5PFQ9_9BACT|nr:CBS domain-containing protein [Hydrogenimonas thermophila]WOE70750.1 CBS domain-containing protein [Hydrogenimonas thermophila]WOE73268.1 CBS domain-containing protein [Hydrogenimonas thermophila]SFP32707.1 CBS domain-containing protein [Hydrogenimonas thermophila]
MLVEEVMTPKDKLIIVSPMAPVREALMLMKKNKVKAIIVEKTSENGAYGLVTFKNILQSIVAEDGDIDLLNVYDIASTPSVSVSRKLDMKYAARMMVRNSIKRLLVIDNNEIYGILTMSDIIGVLLNDID